MTTLLELKAPKERFARSINVERDVDSSALDGYLPVGRAIEVITRIVTTLSNPNSENAFSVTGPYGSGKSSLAVVLDALFAQQNDANRKTANEIIKINNIFSDNDDLIFLIIKIRSHHQLILNFFLNI